MTVVSLPLPRIFRPPPEGAQRRGVVWLRTHWLSLLVLAPLLAVVGFVGFRNFDGYPGTVNDDEGTYVAQAWAIVHRGDLAHYTYWYDHPPLGWIQIAFYAWLTRGFDRADVAVVMGREVMLIATVVTAGLIFLILRRLRFNRAVAAVGVVLFTLSPLAVYYHRMVFLDNIAVAWVVAAMALAVSPRRSLGAAFGAGACLTIATLSKETAGIALPVVVYLLWRNNPKGSRSWALGVFSTTYLSLCSFYLLYAALKGELLPGTGHVSMVSALIWQMFGRPPSGNPLDTGSGTHGLLMHWLHMDWWLPLGALALLPLAFVYRRLRPIALGYAIQVALLFKSGYVPKAYVIALLPFAALLVAGVIGNLCTPRPQHRFNLPGVAAAVALVLAFGVFGSAQWREGLHRSATRDSVVHYEQTLAWVRANIPRDAAVVVDDNLWPDLQKYGYTRAEWLYKVDLDPEVKARFPRGYTDIDYVVIDRLPEQLLRGLPTVYEAIGNSDVVARFGNEDIEYSVYRVRHNTHEA